MAKVMVRLYTTLKDRVGAAKLTLEGGDVREVLENFRKNQPDVEGLLFVKGVVKNHFTLALNSEVLDPKKVAEIKVKEGDILHIFPPIAGG